MKVLLLTYHYPPDRAVGALRPAKVAAAFRDAGHEIAIVTAALRGEAVGIRAAEGGITVHAVRPWRNPRDFYAAAKRRLDRGSPSSAQERAPSAARVPEPVTVPAWKRWIFSLFWLPDDRQGFIPAAIAAARSAFPAPPDLVLSTAPPFSVHLAGYLIHRRTGAPWIAEFRDPWTANPWKPWHARSAFSDAAERWLERRSVRSADALVGVTEGISRTLRTVEPDCRIPIRTIRNGIDQLRPPLADTAGPAVRPLIVHVGTLYHDRDPRPFLDALACLAADPAHSGPVPRALFVGNCEWFKGLSVQAEIDRRGLTESVELKPWVPREEVERILESADVLLMLAQNQPNQVPNKLYEYLGTRKTIIAYADEDGESARMLRQVGGHVVISTQSSAEQGQLLGAALRPTRVNRGGDGEMALQSWRTESQMAELVRLAEEVR